QKACKGQLWDTCRILEAWKPHAMLDGDLGSHRQRKGNLRASANGLAAQRVHWPVPCRDWQAGVPTLWGKGKGALNERDRDPPALHTMYDVPVGVCDFCGVLYHCC